MTAEIDIARADANFINQLQTVFAELAEFRIHKWSVLFKASVNPHGGSFPYPARL